MCLVLVYYYKQSLRVESPWKGIPLTPLIIITYLLLHIKTMYPILSSTFSFHLKIGQNHYRKIIKFLQACSCGALITPLIVITYLLLHIRIMYPILSLTFSFHLEIRQNHYRKIIKFLQACSCGALITPFSHIS